MAACRSCNAPIVWAITEKGKRIPVDEQPRGDGNLVLFRERGDLRARSARLPDDQLRPRHVSHFATCPKADHHRRKK